MAKLKCDKCGAEIVEGSRFCPQCANPVTDAEYINDAESDRGEDFHLVCPKCEKQSTHVLDLMRDAHTISCPSCKSTFESQIAQIRAKKSRGSKKDGTRSFSIRVQMTSGREELIEFDNASYDDFELRSKDLAAFSFFRGHLKVVQNLNVGRYMTVSKPGCYLATMVYGADSVEVQALRSFRDRVLLHHFATILFVRIYYRFSPWLARRFGGLRAVHGLIRLCLKPIVQILRMANFESNKAVQHGDTMDSASRRK